MEWLAVIASVLKILAILISLWKEKDDAKQKRKKEILDEATKAFASKDTSAINLAFSKLKNINK